MTSDSSRDGFRFLCTPSAGIFGNDIQLPALPMNVVRETNLETFHRLGHDLAIINLQELSALTAYRLYLPDDGGRSSWGYCLEAARNEMTDEVVVLFRNDEEEGLVRTLRWLPFSMLCTVKQAEVSYKAQYKGPSEEVMRAILYLFHDVFAFAADTDWSYMKRMEFYHFFPFEELVTAEAVHSFRPILFRCPAFANSVDIDLSPPKSE